MNYLIFRRTNNPLHGVQHTHAWCAAHTHIIVDPALTPTGHFGSPSVMVQPTSAAKPCTEQRTRECDTQDVEAVMSIVHTADI